jgi:hypothetical protein
MTKLAALAAAAAIPLVILAFWPLYLSRPFADVDRYTHLHAMAGSLWLLLLIVQPLAIYHERYRLHLTLGKISYIIAPLFVIAGVLLSHYRLSAMTDETFTAEGFSHYLPFYASIIFALAYSFGLWHRRDAEAHGRFMLLTAIPLIDPVLGRVMAFNFPALPSPWLYQAVTFSVATILAAILVFSYRGPARSRRALAIYFVALVALELGWFSASLTPQWLEAVRFFRGLPLT